MTESNPVPHNLEAERAVLGAALVNPTAFDIAAGLIDATDFFRKAHSSIWRAMAELRHRDMVVDLVTIRDALAKASQLDDVGGPAFISGLADGVPASTNVGYYARIVREHSIRRNVLALAPTGNPEALAGAVDSLRDLATVDPADADTLAPLVDVLDVDAGTAMVPDAVLPGLAWRGRLSVIAGNPKAGKSTLLAQGIAAMLSGETFLSNPAAAGSIVIVTEEPIALAAARLRMHGLGPDHAGRCYLAAPSKGGRLFRAIRRLSPALVVIDSFSAFAVASGAETLNDAAGMRRITDVLRAIADTGTAVLLVHHVRKADGALADSRDIAAAVDMIVSFTLGDVHTRRVLRYEGRWPLETRTLDFNTRTRRYAVADSVTESEGNYDEDDIA